MPGQIAGIVTMRDHDRGEGRTSGERGRFLAWLGRFDAGRFIAAELAVIVAAVACFSAAQSDTYWHLAAGRAMSQTGRVMLTDEFSHTNFGAPWLNYEWLSQVIFYHVHRVGGMPLLTALCAVLALGSCILAWKLVRGPVADRALLVVIALPLVTPGWSLRPQAFTMFLLVAVVHLVVRERFLLLPPLFCLWANLHGAVALGLVVLVADFVAAAVSRRGWRRRAVFGLLSFGATLLTPLGLSLWPEVWRSVSRSSVNRITEWMPPALSPEFALFWMLAAVLAWLALTRWQRLDRPSGSVGGAGGHAHAPARRAGVEKRGALRAARCTSDQCSLVATGRGKPPGGRSEAPCRVDHPGPGLRRVAGSRVVPRGLAMDHDTPARRLGPGVARGGFGHTRLSGTHLQSLQHGRLHHLVRSGAEGVSRQPAQSVIPITSCRRNGRPETPPRFATSWLGTTSVVPCSSLDHSRCVR